MLLCFLWRSRSCIDLGAMTGKEIIKLTAVGAGVFVLKSAFGRLFEYDFNNKTVLITGGSRGLGLVLAREFAREGARIAICARDERELERARIDLEKSGAEVMAIKCDITNKQEVDEMVAAITRRFGHIDVTSPELSSACQTQRDWSDATTQLPTRASSATRYPPARSRRRR